MTLFSSGLPDNAAPERLGRLIAASPAMRATLQRIREIAATDASVIISGETGTGKELVAEAIHENSPRRGGPYIVVDCASVARELVESELFGHARGAFTGAVETRAGAFESASGGTVFIDEIGELPLDLQPRLLRVLERHEVKPVGSNQLQKIDCRIVSATNRNLTREVAEGRFREDLYYRMAVIELELPPLRARPEDVTLLAQSFLADSLPGESLEIDDRVLERLRTHSWPGNVRELRNTIERSAALSDRVLRLPRDFGENADLHAPPGRESDGAEDVQSTPPSLGNPAPAFHPAPVTRPLWAGKPFRAAKEAVLEDFERGYVADLLQRHGHNVSSAAREAGIHRNILHRMIVKHGLGRARTE